MRQRNRIVVLGVTVVLLTGNIVAFFLNVEFEVLLVILIVLVLVDFCYWRS